MKRLVMWVLSAWAIGAVALTGCSSLGGAGGAAGGGGTPPGTGAPATPAGLYAECASAVVVGLRWDAPPEAGWWQRFRLSLMNRSAPSSTDRSGRYSITRNGVLLATTSATNFVDTTVAAATTYRYSVIDSSSGRTGTMEVDTPAASALGDAPYCKSRQIDSITFDWADGHTEPNGSDLWPVTWGKDGNVYTFFGDGGGFGGDNYRGRVSFGVAMMTAPPPLTPEKVRNVYGGFHAAHPSTLDGKAGSIIAVGNDFYAVGGLYDAHDLQGVSGHKSGAPKRTQLGYSKGNAHSWRAASWSFCSNGSSSGGNNASPETAVGAFCPVGFVNYGRGNAGAPDGYVYLLGVANSPAWWAGDDGPEVVAALGRNAAAPPPGTNTAPVSPPGTSTVAATAPGPTPPDSGASTYLARVSKRHVLQRDAYRYFAGTDARGRPVWSDDQKQMQPVFTDRNPNNRAAGLESAIYDPGIGRYIATAQGEFIGQTSFYDAPHPWGPWTTIAYHNIDPRTGAGGWANLGKAGGGSLGVHIVNAWTSADGLSVWMTYSSDGKAPLEALFPPAGTMLDSFNLVSARLNLATPTGSSHGGAQ